MKSVILIILFVSMVFAGGFNKYLICFNKEVNKKVASKILDKVNLEIIKYIKPLNIYVVKSSEKYEVLEKKINKFKEVKYFEKDKDLGILKK